MTKIKELLEHYKTKKNEINKRLKDFESINEKPDEEIFAELAFCILTPQSNAEKAWNSIESLIKNNWFDWKENRIKSFLNGKVRYPNEKAERIVKVREQFTINGKLNLKNKIMEFKDNPRRLRDLLENRSSPLKIKGYGLKESSHFIRNIGLSNNQFAILDVHIMKNLKELDVIDEIPKSLTKKKYLEIERKMKEFSEKVKIPIDELDIALFSKETGRMIKYIK